jgi:cytochrome c553
MSRVPLPRPPVRALASLVLCLLASACSRGPAQAGDDGVRNFQNLPSGHVQAGAVRANVKSTATGQSCLDCHGVDGNAPIDPSYPHIGGQYDDYLAHALRAYRDGERRHPLMSLQAENLSDQDIADLAAYFGARPSRLRDLHGSAD